MKAVGGNPLLIIRRTVRDSRARKSAWLAAVILALLAANLKPAMFVAAVVGLFFGAYTLTMRAFGVRSRIDIVLLTWTIAVAYLSLSAELMSLLRVLGHPWAWLAVSSALFVAAIWVGPGGTERRAQRLSLKHLGLNSLGLFVLSIFALHLATAFILTWFTGINVYDSISTYLPKAVNYLQRGTFSDYSIRFSHLPYLHTILVSFTLVFLGSDILVNVLSWVFATMVSLCLFAFARRMRWRGWLPWAAVLVPLSMPVIFMHASGSNFDLFAGQWLLFALYFMRRAFPSTSAKWAAAGAAATGLAMATKPTFWYAAPGLGMLWIVMFLRPIRKGRFRRAVWLAAACFAIVVLLGTPFLVRNKLKQDYFLGPTSLTQTMMGPISGIKDRTMLLLFNSSARGYQLLTPPFLLPDTLASRLDDLWVSGMEAIGFRLPDPRFTIPQTRSGLIRHAAERYHSDHAYFGATFVLVILPSVLVVLFTRWLPAWQRAYARAAVFAGGMYFLTIGLVNRYTFTDGRWLIEMTLLLAVVAPALFFVLPSRVAGVVAILLAAVAVAEVNDVIRHDRTKPLNLVAQVARAEQYYYFFGEYGIPFITSVRRLNLKYPPSEFPAIFVTGENPPLYAYMGPDGARRVSHWTSDAGNLQLPGLVVTRDAALVSRFAGSPYVHVERLSEADWALIPNDRFRVYFDLRRHTFQPSQDRLLLQARHQPHRYRHPLFRFSLISNAGEVILADFSPNPDFEVAIGKGPPATIKVEVREEGAVTVNDSYWLPPDRYRGL